MVVGNWVMVESNWVTGLIVQFLRRYLMRTCFKPFDSIEPN